MANPYSGIVAGKLAYTQALLRLEGSQSGSNPIVQAALSQGALLHLQGAWQAFLREIAANYQLRHMDEVISAQALHDALGAEGKVPSEASELRDLEADPISWVGQLLQLSQQVDGLSPAVVSDRSPSAISANGVIAAAGGLSQTALDAPTVQRLLTAFVELIDRQRNTMIEC